MLSLKKWVGLGQDSMGFLINYYRILEVLAWWVLFSRVIGWPLQIA